ncbi:MAG: CoA-binding protein [Leptolyngbyaceae cyanobacterium]
MEQYHLTDAERTQILTTAKAIAIVGYSPKRDRPSYDIGRFLQTVGYQVYPINPGVTTIDGQPCFPSLSELPCPVDIVNVFRRSEYVPAIVEETIRLHQRYPNAAAPTLWTQLGVIHDQAAQIAVDAGLTVVMNRCIKIDYRALVFQA